MKFRTLFISGMAFAGAMALLAQKGANTKKPDAKPKTETAAPQEPAVEFEEVWLKVGVVYNYPSSGGPAVVYPTDKRFLPTPKTPLRIRGPKNGKVAVLVDGQPLHTQYKVKPRKGSKWSYRPEKGDFVERMIRRPKPVQPEPEIVEAVQKEEKDELDDWNSADVETVKDNQTIVSQVQETNAKSEEYRKPFHERLFGISAGYTSNYTEYFAQYFSLPSAAWLMRADIGNYQYGRLYFDYLAAQAPSDLPAGSAYKNPNFWKIGYRGRYFGAFFKSQGNANPAGLMVRDRTNSEFGGDVHYGFNLAGFLWMNLGSNLIFYYYDKPSTATTTSLTQLAMLLNVTADASMTLLRQGGLYDILAQAGTAFSIIDSTNSGYDAAGTWQTANRSMAFGGLRLGLSAHFYVIDTVRLTANTHVYTLMSPGYQRYINSTRDTASTMFVATFTAEFRM